MTSRRRSSRPCRPRVFRVETEEEIESETELVGEAQGGDDSEGSSGEE